MLSECPVLLSPDQRQAVQTALSSKVCVLTTVLVYNLKRAINTRNEGVPRLIQTLA